ncbi:alanine dehydrogenase [Paraburkholderia kururiensis]|uniref:alanine dehydrogenase n=1 Tax=Paraburkholderia kururiensis TaxID=984307 RepID=UPI000F87419E|nr:alanine dehydrogenase [Paraburkholderia kururiensis]
MLIGVPKEIKSQEYRVGLTPAGAQELVGRGHQVLVQTRAGAAVGLPDEAYVVAGAAICNDARDLYARSEMIIKVKEPRAMLRPGQILYAYLHLAPDREQADALIASGAVCVAYETITDPGGGLPLLAPMSEVAGRMSIQVAAANLEKPHGGMGLLLAGVPGVAPGHVVIIGAGVVGTHALQIAVGLGARVTILDRNVERLRQLDLIFGNRITTLSSSAHAIERSVLSADAVIGAVLIPGAAAPRLVTRDTIGRMKKGAVVVDVAVDQGGCFETSRATTHAQPTYVVDGVIHYCVANMPGAVPRTSTFALTNATLGHAIALADKGWKRAMADDAHLRAGLNVCEGHVTHDAVATALGRPYVPASDVLR